MAKIINIDVFVLDNEQHWLDLVEKVFKHSAKFKYSLFTDKVEFLEAVKKGINICIIDQFLGKESGLDVMKEALKLNPLNNCIVMSGELSIELWELFQAAGSRYILSKKNVHLLVGIVQKLIDEINDRLETFLDAKEIKGVVSELQQLFKQKTNAYIADYS